MSPFDFPLCLLWLTVVGTGGAALALFQAVIAPVAGTSGGSTSSRQSCGVGACPGGRGALLLSIPRSTGRMAKPVWGTFGREPFSDFKISPPFLKIDNSPLSKKQPFPPSGEPHGGRNNRRVQSSQSSTHAKIIDGGSFDFIPTPRMRHGQRWRMHTATLASHRRAIPQVSTRVGGKHHHPFFRSGDEPGNLCQI